MNIKIKEALSQHKMTYWMLADLLSKSESSITRMMRHELPEVEQDRICRLIQDAAEKEAR